MEFTVNKVLFEKTLQGIVKLIPPKSTYTVLQNIIIEAKENKIFIEGTDLDIFVKKIMPVQVKKEGKVLLPGKKLLEITREANVDELNFKLKELNLGINAGNAYFNIPALDYQEFPEIPKFPEKKWFELSIGEFSEQVDKTIFMVSKDIARRPMNGVLIQIKENNLNMVTTDGARLALFRRGLSKGLTQGEVIVSPKVFELIENEKPEEKIEVFIEERMVGMKFMDTSIIARLIEGPYPNYEGVIPRAFIGTCIVERSIIEGGLKRVSLVSSPNLKNVKFDFKKEGLLLSSSSPDIGEAKEEIPCKYEGEGVGIWYNAQFFLEILRHINTDEAVIQITSATSATLIKPKEDENLLYLLMPLRIDSYE
uniref:Beta sliding clamp n=1 Tax=candidate division WOR-3 bacterium TaxID=2052148 RepID=A0A7C4XNG3_UNCW3